MISTIDESGRLVIPRDIRRAAGLTPGMPLTVRVEEGSVIIEPAPTPVRIVRRGRFMVAQPIERSETLSQHTVEETRQRLANERGKERDSSNE